MADTKNTDRSAAVASEEEELFRKTDVISEEAEEAVEEADEISEEAEEAAEEAEEAAEEADEVSEEADEAVEEADEISEEADEISEEADEVSEEADEISEEADEISEEADEVSEEADEVSEEAEEAVEEAEEADEISEEAEEAVEEADEISEEADEISEEADEISEEADEISEEADEISEETEEAAEEADEISEEADKVSEEVDEVSEEVEEAAEEANDSSDGEEDELYDDAVFLAQDIKDLTPFVLQRELRIGYARAGRIFEQLKADGYVASDDEAEGETDGMAGDVSDEEDVNDTADADNTEDYIDEDDYLDYDDDSARPRKIVSGRTAVVTMLAAFLGAVLAVVLAFLFATRFQRSTGVTFVSYTDRFNACRTNDFAYGNMLGIGTVSYSDADTTFSADDIRALRSGKTVTKFDGLADISVRERFGKLVSLDVKFSPELDKASNPSGLYALLAGNVISGLLPGVDSSDAGFMAAYTILSYSAPVDEEGRIFSYELDDLNFRLDYSKAMDSKNISDITLHVESAAPHYLEPSRIDTSWLPELPGFSEKEDEPTPTAPSVSDADVSPSDN